MNGFWEGIITEVYHIYQLINFYIFFFFSAGVDEKERLELLGRIMFLPELSL